MRIFKVKKIGRYTLPLLFLANISARAQEGLSDAMTQDSARQAREKQEQSQDYTIKSGDFRMLITPALSLQWNDNVNCVATNREQDLIVLPTVDVITSYPLTDRNLLQFNINMGYSAYVLHPDLSSYYLQSGSGLSFDLYVKKILINFHDQFSYTENASQNPGLAGSGLYGTFQNSAGLSGEWDLKRVVFTVGYDHQNLLSTSSQFSDTDSSTESSYARAGYKWNSKLTTGVESTAAFTSYDQNALNDNSTYSIGFYGDWQPNSFLHVQPRIGFTIDQFQQSSQDLHNSNLVSWYTDLNISHKISRSITYSLDVGHQISPGVQSDVDENWYANSSIDWNFIKSFEFHTSFFYQHGNQGEGTTPIGTPNSNLVSEIYDWYGGGLGLTHPITRRLSMDLNYEITERSSSISGRGYTQNLVGILLTYHL